MEEDFKFLKALSPRKSFISKIGKDISELPNYADIYEKAKENHQQKELLEDQLKQFSII